MMTFFLFFIFIFFYLKICVINHHLKYPGSFLDFHKKVSCKKSQLPFCSLGGKLGPQTASRTAARELARA